MPNITKPDMSVAWAASGTKVEPDSSKISLGWTAEKPPFQTENWVQNRTDTYIRHLEERGAPEWDALVIYSLGSQVYYAQKIWHSLINSNLGTSPVAGAGFWIPVTELHNPPGSIMMYGGNGGSPAGWLSCNGALYTITSHPRLHGVLGSTFNTGGEAASQFRVPNFIDRSPMGDGGEFSAGAAEGFRTTTLSITHLPAHSHPLTDPGHRHQLRGNSGGSGGAKTDNGISGSADVNAIDTNTTGITMGNTGSGTAFDNRHPILAVKFIIKDD